MTGKEIVERLFAAAIDKTYEKTCDTWKAGDPERPVTKLGTAMFATPDVIRAASEWGAQLLIVHEPLYYNHWDDHSAEAIETEKRRRIEESGIGIVRFHDHPHEAKPDFIIEGLLRKMALSGTVEQTERLGLSRVHLNEPITPVALAKRIEETTGLRHVRICGARDCPCREISVTIGAIGELVMEELQNPQQEIVLAGETREWGYCEYARDAAQLGYKKSLLVLGHVGSERDGMAYTAEVCQKLFPQLETRYFECGEVFTYTD